jgi:NitT/TauT family transport system substrate-binding protein
MAQTAQGAGCRRGTRVLASRHKTNARHGERFCVGSGWRRRRSAHDLKDLPDGKWREYVAEDTVRFYALRLHETGTIRTSPQKIIALGTDWRFLNELKKDLKG